MKITYKTEVKTTTAKKAKGSKTPPVETKTTWTSFSFQRDCGHIEAPAVAWQDRPVRGHEGAETGEDGARRVAEWLAGQLCSQCHGSKSLNSSLVQQWASFWDCSEVDAEARLTKAISGKRTDSLWPPKEQPSGPKADAKQPKKG